VAERPLLSDAVMACFQSRPWWCRSDVTLRRHGEA
jgi:hypothetical protein